MRRYGNLVEISNRITLPFLMYHFLETMHFEQTLYRTRILTLSSDNSQDSFQLQQWSPDTRVALFEILHHDPAYPEPVHTRYLHFVERQGKNLMPNHIYMCFMSHLCVIRNIPDPDEYHIP